MAIKVLVLGGGSGGLVAANKIKQLLREDVDVILIDRSPYHYFMPGFLWLAFGMREADEVRRPLQSLEKRGVTFVQAEIQAIDPERKKVATDRGEFGYDYLVVSLGAEPTSSVSDSLAPWSFQGALQLRHQLKSFKGGKVVVGVSSHFYPCPPACYEVAGMAEFALRVKGVRDHSSVHVFHVDPVPLAGMGPLISQSVLQVLKKKGVSFHGNFELAEVADREVKAKDGRKLEYDLLILVPAFAPNRVVSQSKLAGPHGFPTVDRTTFRHLQYPEVFVIGDTVNPSLKLPTAGVVAHFQAEYLAGVIASDQKGAYVGQPFNPVAMCIMDFGDNALLPQCNFEPVLTGKGMPSCGVMAVGRWVRMIKMLFESYWFATLLG